MSNLPKNCVFVLVLSFVLLLSLSIPSVKADIIHGEFTGAIGWLSINNNPHLFYLGQTLTGWFTYNRNTTDTNPDPGVGVYELSAPSEVYVIIQGIRYGTDAENPQFYMWTYNDREFHDGTVLVDQLCFQTYWPTHTKNDLYISFSESQAKALSDDELPPAASWLLLGAGNNGTMSLSNENGQIASVELSMVSVVSKPSNPEEKLLEILDFFDESVAEGTLVGEGPGNSADGRLGALRDMLDIATDYIGDELYVDACDQLWDAYLKCDGEPIPPDFVSEPAAIELAAMIQEVIDNLGCE